MGLAVSRVSIVKAALLFGIWTAYGVLCAWQAHYWYSLSKTPMSWADSFRYQLTYAYLWGACTPPLLWFARRFRFEKRRWLRNLLIHVCMMLVVVSVIKVAFDAITMPQSSAFRAFSWEKLYRSFQTTFDTGTLLYALVVLVEHALIYYRSYETGLIKASQLQTQLIQAQLQALKMQLHPHFLFNTLHTVTALVHEDPDMAERTIARLSELLRLFMANSTIHEVPLSEELRILDLYLEIERARFEERLQIRYDVPAALREATVPNLVLQPLVENSIRHGLGKRAEAGWIVIAAESFAENSEAMLVLRVTDNGAGFEADTKCEAGSGLEGGSGNDRPRHQGMGLAITRGRLESLYGPRQSLVLRNLPEGGVEARISMPLKVPAVTDAGSNNESGEGHVELQSADR